MSSVFDASFVRGHNVHAAEQLAATPARAHIANGPAQPETNDYSDVPPDVHPPIYFIR